MKEAFSPKYWHGSGEVYTEVWDGEIKAVKALDSEEIESLKRWYNDSPRESADAQDFEAALTARDQWRRTINAE